MMKAVFRDGFFLWSKTVKKLKNHDISTINAQKNKNYAFYKLIIDILTKKGYNINCKNKKWFYNQMKRGGENVR